MPLSKHRRRRGRVTPGSGHTAASLSINQSGRKKTNWWYVGASALIAVLVIGGFALGSAGIGGGRGFNRTGNSDEYVEGIGVQHDIHSTRSHLTQGQNVEYNSIPATSGDHWAQWARCGFFEEGLPDERIVHNLEHSNIVVSYNLATPEEVKRLRDVMDSVGLSRTHGVTRFYDKLEPGIVTLSAWGVSDTMTDIDEERINTFFKTYGGTLGPEGNIPCLNSGVMPQGSPQQGSPQQGSGG